MKLYYNASHPTEILESLTVKTSTCCGRDRGVSMSAKQLDCHGPFTFVFVGGVWQSRFVPVQYGQFPTVDFIHKPDMFENEAEWWSPEAVRFRLEDLEAVIFRPRSPGARIHPIIGKRTAARIAKEHPNLYKEKP